MAPGCAVVTTEGRGWGRGEAGDSDKQSLLKGGLLSEMGGDVHSPSLPPIVLLTHLPGVTC